MKILVVEDENALREVIVRSLEKERYVVESASSFREASLKINDYDYDCIVLDIMLPGGSGLTLLKELRALRKKDSIIIISAKDSIEDKVTGLDLGADDYLTKPFAMKELLARIRSITRRMTEAESSSLQLGNVVLDLLVFTLEVEGNKERLPNKEFQMLQMLLANPSQIISTERFMEKIWGFDSDADIQVVWVYISYLRKRLKAMGANVVIRAKRNQGYFVEVEPD